MSNNSNKKPQSSNDSPGLEAYIQRGSNIDTDKTKYIIIKAQNNTSVFYEWFKFDTPVSMLYNFVYLIDPKIAEFELYKSSKNDPQKIEKNDKRKLKDIFNTHIAEFELRFKQ